MNNKVKNNQKKIIFILLAIIVIILITLKIGYHKFNFGSKLIDRTEVTSSELTEKMQKYFTSKLNNKYTYVGQAGKIGARTAAYLMKDDDGSKYILKIPNSPKIMKEWIQNQKTVWSLIKSTFNDYKGNAKIPEYINIGEDYILEKYLGNDLTKTAYNYLTSTEKDNIAKDMANLLIYLHSKSPKGVEATENALDNLENNLDGMYDYIKNCNNVNKKDKSDLEQKINLYKNRDKSDEFITLTHGDIRAQNVLYDQETKKVAIIDWELMSIRNVYSDFVPFAAASFGLSYDLLFDIIDIYNELSTKKINKDKLKLTHELGIWYEYERCAVIRGEKELDKTIVNMIQSCIDDLEKAYQRNISKQ